MYNQGIDMRIHVNGRSCKEYNHQGQVFIESRHGTNYTVKLKNDNAYRVMVVLSVDGLDVISGKPAEETDKGYIVDAYSSTEIKGYRISDTDSAAFVFTSKGKSYVAKSGQGSVRNSGVIGVRVFREKEKPAPAPTVVHHHHYHTKYVYPWSPYYVNTGGYTIHGGQWINAVNTTGVTLGGATTTGNSMGATNMSVTYRSADTHDTLRGASVSNDSLSSKSAMASVKNVFDDPISYKDFDTGTTWGKKQVDKVKREYFEKGALLTELVMYYATKEALFKMGIDLQDEPRIADAPMPQPFGGRYCQPPKGWQG